LNNTIEFEDGILSKTTIWNDVFLTKPEHKVIARYNSPSPSIDQKAAIVGCKVGKGEIVVMGAMPEQERLLALIKTYLKKADCAPKLKTSSNVLAIKRRNGDKIGYCVIELFYEKGWVELDGQYLDVETSTKLSGVIEIEPYSFRCLEKID
jgi:beta-galactosidase GanA